MERLFGIGLGGAAARSYGGITPVQELKRLYAERKATSFSLFRSGSGYDIGRVGATKIVNGAAIYAAWKGGLFVGSAISVAIDRAMNGCKK